MDENISIFVEENKVLISGKVNEENQRRTASGNLPLTNEEIHENVIQMFNMSVAGQDITQYQIKQPQMQRKIRQPIIPETTPEIKIPVSEYKTTFEIIECDNGFILNSVKNGSRQSYIFKQEKDLMKIFRKLIKIPEDVCKQKSLEPKNFKSSLKKKSWSMGFNDSSKVLENG